MGLPNLVCQSPNLLNLGSDVALSWINAVFIMDCSVLSLSLSLSSYGLLGTFGWHCHPARNPQDAISTAVTNGQPWPVNMEEKHTGGPAYFNNLVICTRDKHYLRYETAINYVDGSNSMVLSSSWDMNFCPVTFCLVRILVKLQTTRQKVMHMSPPCYAQVCSKSDA